LKQFANSRRFFCLAFVRRPGSPIAGLKHHRYRRDVQFLHAVRRPGSPIAGLKQSAGDDASHKQLKSEGLEARLRD